MEVRNCLKCEEELSRRTKENVSDFKTRKFCNRACSNQYYNNRGKQAPAEKFCNACGSQVERTKRINGTWSKEKYCNSCRESIRTKGRTLELQTKGNLFANRSNWQSARSSIQEHARRMFKKSDKEKACYKCGYNKHYEVAHIKSVSEFTDDTLVNEINALDNLMALCPNHHWEYDNGL